MHELVIKIEYNNMHGGRIKISSQSLKTWTASECFFFVLYSCISVQADVSLHFRKKAWDVSECRNGDALTSERLQERRATHHVVNDGRSA